MDGNINERAAELSATKAIKVSVYNTAAKRGWRMVATSRKPRGPSRPIQREPKSRLSTTLRPSRGPKANVCRRNKGLL
jgi:hypothetical protein